MDLANLATLLLISGNVHPYPGPISNHPHPRHPCSHLPSGCGQRFSSMLCLLKWVRFLCSFLTRADFCTICATGTAVAGDASVPSPKKTGSPHSDQSPCYAACVPLPRAPPWFLPLPPGFYHSRPPRGLHVTLAPFALSR